MNFRRIIPLALALAALATTAPASARNVTETYVGSSQLTLGGTCRNATLPVNIGKACFNVQNRDNSVRITVADDVVGPAGFFYILSDANGDCVGSNPDPTNTDACPGAGIHCGTANIAILPGSRSLEVWVDGVTGPVDCLVFDNKSSAGAGFSGRVIANFS